MQDKDLDLALVMPVYNEEECIREVVQKWREVLNATAPAYRLIVLNDGSRDGSAEALRHFSGSPDVEVINKHNSGHGPTILEGYRRAIGLAQWVFQVDSDDEMSPESFPALWARRDDYDLLFGIRNGRRQNTGRKLISQASRLVVRLFFGPGVKDVNTPYRLMRASILDPMVERIPAATFAPNILISGFAARWHCRICNMPVPHTGRLTGTVSIVKWKLWKSAVKACLQIVQVALTTRPVDVASVIKDTKKT